MALIRQCELRCDNHVTVTWLPERIARLGNHVEFRDDSRDWVVSVVYDKIEEDKLSRKYHSLPKSRP